MDKVKEIELPEIYDGMLEALELSIDLIKQYEEPRFIACGKNSMTFYEVKRIYSIAKQKRIEINSLKIKK